MTHNALARAFIIFRLLLTLAIFMRIDFFFFSAAKTTKKKHWQESKAKSFSVWISYWDRRSEKRLHFIYLKVFPVRVQCMSHLYSLNTTCTSEVWDFGGYFRLPWHKNGQNNLGKLVHLNWDNASLAYL